MLAVLGIVLALGACATDSPPVAQAPLSSSATAAGQPGAVPTSVPAASVAGTVLRFSSGPTSVDVTIDQDSPAARDLVAMMPLTLTVEEFSGREKIADLPQRLAYEGTPGSDPEDGDLIYYIPWGNLGFYYNTAGVGYSEQTLHLGTYRATLDELTRLQGPGVRVEVVR